MRSTLTGWQPRVGDLVWQQMYSPQRPAVDSTIEERISAGATYGDRRRMIVTRVVPDFNVPGLTRWCMRKPGRDLGPAHWSYVESDWCVLEPVTLAEALEAERDAADAPEMLPLFDLTDTGTAA